VKTFVGFLFISAALMLSNQAFGAKIDGYQRQNDGDYQFSTLIQGEPDSAYYLKLSGIKSEEVFLSVVLDGNVTKLTDYRLEPGFPHQFPPGDQSIILPKTGTYTYKLKSSTGRILDSLIIDIVGNRDLNSFVSNIAEKVFAEGHPIAEKADPEEFQLHFMKDAEILVPDDNSLFREIENAGKLDGVYVLQAGTFKNIRDAENLRSELLLMNLSAESESFKIRNGDIRHSVLVGPFTNNSKMASARAKLAQNNIDSLKLKRKQSPEDNGPVRISNFSLYLETTKSIEPITVTSGNQTAGSKIYKEYSGAVPLIENMDGLGSGIFIENDLILTNKHVVGEQSIVRVALKPSGFGMVKTARRYEGRVIKFDETKDLALIKLNIEVKDIPLVKLAREEDVEVAMQVHAIGHPRGEYWSYTLGYVSQFRPNYSWTVGSGAQRLADVIQTQTPINPGNSGGPLLSSNGKLIGINSFGQPDSPGLNFAIAYTSVKEFLDSDASISIPKAVSSEQNNGDCEDLTTDEGWAVERCDMDGNGKADRITLDSRLTGGYLEVYYDLNENNIFELMVRLVESGRDSVWIINLDPDEAGSWTQRGADYDKDGSVDEWLE
tara:strand:- start:1091 stop:2908 length:1818 start_codon:yes stop_codon:yes gene_type:complete